jgi:signal peptidase I
VTDAARNGWVRGGVTRRATLGAAAPVLAGVLLAGCSDGKPILGRAVLGASAGGDATTHRLTVGSDSMDPTIVAGQAITVDGLTPGAYRPRRQDIVVLHPTSEYRGLRPTDLILRRVIGIPGDTVSCDGGGAALILNGSPLHEPYLHPGDAPSTMPFDVRIPAGCLWLLGDHRAVALDCRYHLSDPDHGAIPVGNVVGTDRPKAV